MGGNVGDRQNFPPPLSSFLTSVLIVLENYAGQEKTRENKGLFWRDTLKVAKNFLGPKMPPSAFWREAFRGSQALSPLPLKVSRQN